MDIAVGQKATRTLTLTAEHVKTFAELTGDYNPLHFDESFVANTKFKRLNGETVLEGETRCYTFR